MDRRLPDVEMLAGEIVALTALPSRWAGVSPERIAEDVAATLHHLCDELLLVDVRIDLPPTRSVRAHRPHGAARAPVAHETPRLARSSSEAALPIGPVGAHGEILLVARPGADLTHARLLGTVAAGQVEAATRALDLERDVAQALAKVAALGKLGALGQLVGGVAHEIRTPLTYATNGVYLLEHELRRRHPDSVAHLEPHLRDVESGLDRIGAIVNQLRRVVKHVSTVAIEEDLRSLVHEAMRLWRATHPGDGEVQEQLLPTPPILVDRGQLQQVVLNLLQNAQEAVGRKGTVRIETRGEDGCALLVVSDDGPGMTRVVLDNLFQPFRTTKQDGLGLGLSLVRDIVEAHHGAVAIDSAPGRGTTVTVRIPRARTSTPSP